MSTAAARPAKEGLRHEEGSGRPREALGGGAGGSDERKTITPDHSPAYSSLFSRVQRR